MSSDSATIIRDGEDAYRLQITHRDWMLTRGPGFVEACKVGDKSRRYGGGQSIRVGGGSGILWLHPKGYCSITFGNRKPPDLPAIVDLRATKDFMSEAGPIKIHLTSAEIRWLEILPPLLKFLEGRLRTTLSLEHINRAG